MKKNVGSQKQLMTKLFITFFVCFFSLSSFANVGKAKNRVNDALDKVERLVEANPGHRTLLEIEDLLQRALNHLGDSDRKTIRLSYTVMALGERLSIEFENIR